MKFTINRLTQKLTGIDPAYYCTAAAALFMFLFAAFGRLGSYLYTQALAFPCLLLLCCTLSCNKGIIRNKLFLPSVLMVIWFTYLMMRRTIENSFVYSFSLFFCIYLFAFPLACLTQDGEKKVCLKQFSLAMLSAALVLSITAVFLLLDLIPAGLSAHVYWDGARLNAFWHPNIVACFIMFGIAGSIIYIAEAKNCWLKLVLSVLAVIMTATIALTNCRTIILLTGALLGGVLFFSFVKNRWQRILPGLLLACAVVFLVYSGSSQLYQMHSDALLDKYVTQHLVSQSTMEPIETEAPTQLPDAPAVTEETAPAEATPEETPTPAGDNATVTETLPIQIDTATGQAALKTESSQGSLIQDLGTLNSRTMIWSAAFHAFRESRIIQLFGIDRPGAYTSEYLGFEIAHTHNSWIESLLGLGLPGFAIIMFFTALSLWNSLAILLKPSGDIWKTVTALLVLCIMIAALMEPYLFLTTDVYHIVNFLFFLCSGYLAHWQEEDNRKIYQYIRAHLHR